MAQGIPRKAVLILLEEGITVTQIARELGVTKQAVSAHLTGRTRAMSDDLLKWLEVNLDPDTGLEVMHEVYKAREAHAQAQAKSA